MLHPPLVRRVAARSPSGRPWTSVGSGPDHASAPSRTGGRVDIVVKGRHIEVSERFRSLAAEKLGKVERLDPAMQRVDVEVLKESNPRLADRAFRVELTCRGRGPVIRAEAAAEDKLAALDLA